MIVFALLVQGEITRFEGGIFAALILAFLVFVLRSSSSSDASFDDDVVGIVGDKPVEVGREAARAFIGLAFVVVSSYFIVDGAERVANALELSGGFVGFTLVALGTSAPELVTSVQAADRAKPSCSSATSSVPMCSTALRSVASSALLALGQCSTRHWPRRARS